MKEKTKKIILFILLCFVTLAGLIIALGINENRLHNLSLNSDIKNYLTEIKYEEISNYVVEQPRIVIYVSNSSEDETKDFDKKLIPVIKKYNLENEIIYVNINNTTIVDLFYQNAPQLIFYVDGQISDVVDANTLNDKDDIIKILKERSVISD